MAARPLLCAAFLLLGACDELTDEPAVEAGAAADLTVSYEGSAPDAAPAGDQGDRDLQRHPPEPDGQATPDLPTPPDLPGPDQPTPPDLPPPPDTNPCTTGGLHIGGAATKTLSAGTYTFPYVCVSGSAKLTTSGKVTINVTDKCSGVYIKGKGLKAVGAMTINYPGKKAVVIDVDLTSGGANLTVNAPNSTVSVKGTGKGSLYLKLKTKAVCVFAPQSSVKISGGVGSVGGCLPTPKSCP